MTKKKEMGQESDFPPETTVVKQSILIRFGVGAHSRIQRETTNWSLATLIKIDLTQNFLIFLGFLETTRCKCSFTGCPLGIEKVVVQGLAAERTLPCFEN